MILFLIFPVIFGLIGILLLWVHFRMIQKNKQCTSQTTGRVIRINSNTSGRANSSTRTTYYYPVFQYYVNGEEYTITSSTGNGNPKRFPIGATVPVYYNPSSPDKAFIKETSVAFIVGIVFLACAVLFLFLPFFLLRLNSMIYIN